MIRQPEYIVQNQYGVSVARRRDRAALSLSMATIERTKTDATRSIR